MSYWSTVLTKIFEREIKKRERGNTQWLALKGLSLKCRLRQVKQMAMREEKHVSLQWPCLASLFWLRNIHLDSMSHWEHHSIMRSETVFSQASRGHLKQCEQTYNKYLEAYSYSLVWLCWEFLLLCYVTIYRLLICLFVYLFTYLVD